MDMKPLNKGPEVEIPVENGEPRYAMVVIDIFSKVASVIPMKEKSCPNALSAVKQSFSKMGFPMSSYSDNDRAFLARVKDFFDTRQCYGALHQNNEKYDTRQGEI